MTRKKMNLVTIDEISKLEKDWNGYDADAIPKCVCDKARDFLENISEDNQPTPPLPTAADTIQLEWEWWFDKNGDVVTLETAKNLVGRLSDFKRIISSCSKTYLEIEIDQSEEMSAYLSCEESLIDKDMVFVEDNIKDFGIQIRAENNIRAVTKIIEQIIDRIKSSKGDVDKLKELCSSIPFCKIIEY